MTSEDTGLPSIVPVNDGRFNLNYHKCHPLTVFVLVFFLTLLKTTPDITGNFVMTFKPFFVNIKSLEESPSYKVQKPSLRHVSVNPMSLGEEVPVQVHCFLLLV